MNKPAITSVLCIRHSNLSYTVAERLENQNSFTNVTNTDPASVSSKSIGLLCLSNFFGHEIQITHVCIIRKQGRVATGQVRVKGTDTIKLEEKISIDSMLELLPNNLKTIGARAFTDDYCKVPEKTGIAFYEALCKLCPEQKDEIDGLFEKIGDVKVKNGKTRDEDAAVEKDALGICLDIFGIERSDILRSSDSKNSSFGQSFLNGLTEFIAYEDDLIYNDLHTVPGWDVLKQSMTGMVEFKNKDGERLVVINANRKPTERAFGVDLVYFHRTYEAFTLVQYKMMDQKTSPANDQYYNPNQQSHHDELERLRSLKQLLEEQPKDSSLNHYLLANCPLFFKLCKKLQMKNDDGRIAAGAYLPLDQWEILLTDDSTKGPKGGTQIGYHTLKKRYIGTKTFINLVQKGMIGTQGLGSRKIGAFVEASTAMGHSVIYAIDDRIAKQPVAFDEEEDVDI